MAFRLLIKNNKIWTHSFNNINKHILLSTTRRFSVAIDVVLRDQSVKNIKANIGDTLLDACLENEIDIEAACEGACACSTCHVIFDSNIAQQLPIASDDELDMLDLAPGVTEESRLACQITVTKLLDGIKISLPEETINQQDM